MDYLALSNKVLRSLNEVELTSANFANSRGIQTAVKDFVNRSINDIYTSELEWPFLHTDGTITTVAGTADDDGGGMEIVARLFERRIISDVACVDPRRDDIASTCSQPFQYLLICLADEKLDAESELSGKKAGQFVFKADGLASSQKIVLRIDPRDDA